MDDLEDQDSILDLRDFVAEIKKFWQMGDNKIVPEAKRGLLRVLHASAKRLQKPISSVGIKPPQKS